MSAKEDRVTLSILAVATAIVAFGVAVAALWLNSDSESSAASSESGGASGGGAATVSVNLSEFAISPNPIVVPAGKAVSLSVNNAGSVPHNLSIADLGKGTPDLQAGEKSTLDIGSLTPGDYEVICTIAGHAAAGMVATLTVSEDAAAVEGGSGTASATQPVSWEEMDIAMEEAALAFPAKTMGEYAGTLEPEIVDGWKVYELTAKIVDWEVEPGKIVKAWTYNGSVPGPEIKVNVGDKVRIIHKNELPESTSLHLHGVRVPNAYDGVDPFTQAAIPPGAEMVYEFVAQEPAVGMYHSHHDAQVQIPNGMAGALLIGEMPIPESLQTPDLNVVKTINMVINDAGTLGLSLNGKSFPATEPYTLRLGESMIVHYYNEGLTGHPMHLHQPSGWIIAKDGKPLPSPIPADTVWVSPGERYTMLYTAEDLGVWAWHCHILTHAETPEGMRYMVTALIVTE